MKVKTGISGVHLSEAKFRVVIRSFALDLPASNIAELSEAARRLISYS